MADEADIANDYIAQAISSALNKRQQNSNTQLVSKNCADCGEEIPIARRSLGFKLCFECAEESERRKSLFVD